MGVRSYEELLAFQLSRELRDRIVAVTFTPALSRHGDLCVDLRRAVRSAPANIAEGFGRWHRREFIRFLGIAKASLMEAQVHIGDLRALGGLRVDELDEYDRLARRALAATTALIRSLER